MTHLDRNVRQGSRRHFGNLIFRLVTLLVSVIFYPMRGFAKWQTIAVADILAPLDMVRSSEIVSEMQKFLGEIGAHCF